MTRPEFTVALVGRPNVGKSTLFNRIAGRRKAITFGQPGVTRDIVSSKAEIDGRSFILVDTGGYDPGGDSDLMTKVRAQVVRAMFEADAVIFLVDARDGLLPLDKEIAVMLRERGKDFFVAANKVDAKDSALSIDQFHALGVERIFSVSAEHNTGVHDLMRAVIASAPEDEPRIEPDVAARIAVVGRPNVGKSTLINTLVGYERVIASEIPGTTRDSVDVLVEHDGKKYLFIDTAGIRPKRKTEGLIEKVSVIKSLESIKRCDIGVLLVDGPGGLTHQDQQILRYVLDEGRGIVVAANKADLWVDEEARKEGTTLIREQLGFASFAEIVPTVGKTGKGVSTLFKKIAEASENFYRRVPTAELNRAAESFLFSIPIPSRFVRNRAYYITEVGVSPPTFAVFVKDKREIPDAFTRFVQNKIRERFAFEGVPVRILYRER